MNIVICIIQLLCSMGVTALLIAITIAQAVMDGGVKWYVVGIGVMAILSALATRAAWKEFVDEIKK